MNKTFYKILFAAALMCGAMTVTSCDDFTSNTDNPTPTPTPTPTPDPQPSPEELIEQAKQLLADALEDGAEVNISFTYNGKTYQASFKRENDTYVLQSALGDGLDATLLEVDGATAQDPDNFIFTIQDKTSGETLLQVFIDTAEDTVEVKTVDEKITFSGVDVNGETVVMTPTDPSTGSETVFVTSATLDETSLSIGIGRTATLTCTIKPANATDKTVTWTSSDETIATVDENGKVTAIAKGKATITAEPKGQNPHFKIAAPTCEVYVDPVAVTSVALNKTSLELTEGETFTLEATIAPTDAANKDVTWESNKATVASVDKDGKVTALAEGEATITVTTKDGKKTATCTVKVKLLPSPTITDPDDYTQSEENPFS